MADLLPLKDQLSQLANLQELDLQIDRIRKDRGALPSALWAKDDALAVLQKQIDTKVAAMNEVEKIQRQNRAAVEINTDRLARSSTRLESIQNSNEFQAVNKEIDQLKKLATQLEEQMKKSTTDMETIKKDHDDLKAKFDELKAERETLAQELGSQSGKMDEQLSSLSSDRKKFTTGVETRLISNYDRVRQARGGLGIVPAVNGRCKGCNMVLAPQLYNEVQRGTVIHSCPSCHRIVYVPAPVGTTDSSVAGATPST